MNTIQLESLKEILTNEKFDKRGKEPYAGCRERRERTGQAGRVFGLSCNYRWEIIT